MVKIAPHYANRVLTLAIDGPYGRLSDEELEGAAAPKTRTYWFKDVPAGRYNVLVVLQRNDGTAPVVWTEAICLKGAGSEDSCGLGDGGQ